MQVIDLKEALLESSFFVLEEENSDENQDIACQPEEVQAFDLPKEFFKYFQIEKEAA